MPAANDWIFLRGRLKGQLANFIIQSNPGYFLE